jgi:histidine ammonia-lyase
LNTQVIDTPLTFQGVAAVAAGAKLLLSAQATRRIAHARSIVEVIVERNIRAYGVNTGVGALCDTLLDRSQLQALSRNILMSHASGVGRPLSVEQTRGIMACAINNFAHGGSGVRLVVVERLLALLNANLIPVVPREGSVGYISQMAHIAIVLVGEGSVHNPGGGTMSGREALKRLGTDELVLEAKEGLSLINGSPDTTGLTCVALERLSSLLDWADIIAAMTFENIGHSAMAYAPEALRFSASEDIRRVGSRLTESLAGSKMLAGVQVRTQDAMSLRAVPQVHGAVRGCFAAAVDMVDLELASVTDNPIVTGSLEAPQVYSGAYAIATGLALTLDALAIAVAKIAATSERRIDRLVNPLVSGLSPFLAVAPGSSSGFMIAQYTALSLVSENRRLAAPSSLDGGVSSGLQEDEIPHATTGALRLLKIIENFETILSIELLAAAQAYEFKEREGRSHATERIYRQLREVVGSYSDDRPVASDIHIAVQFLRQASAGYYCE